MSAIEPGDLAIVVHYCCDKFQGAVVNVCQVFPSGPTEYMACLLCGHIHWGGAPMAVTTDNDLFPVAWLKKIEPLPEAERELAENAVTA